MVHETVVTSFDSPERSARPELDEPSDPHGLAGLRCPADGLTMREEGATALRCERGHRYARAGRILDFSPGAEAAGFGRWRAATYDLTFDLINVRGLFGATPRRLVELHRAAARAAAAGQGVLLDVGCGTSRWALPELVGARVTRYYGVDPAMPMLRLADKRAARSSKESVVTLIHSEAQHLPLGDGTVDAALSSLGLQFVADPAAALAELRRVLRPGGQLFVAAPALGLRDRYDQRHREREVKDFPLDRDLWPGQLAAAGFVSPGSGQGAGPVGQVGQVGQGDAMIEAVGALLFTHAIAG